LETIRQRLRDKLPVRLVSTQVVEAGVDLDFPLVMRDIGPLDRIVQVAGRCNREGALPQRGRCLLFQLESGCAPQGPYRTGIDLTRQIIELSPDNLDSPEIVAGYFRDLFGHTTVDRVRVNGRDLSVQEMRQALMFATVGKCFRLIPDDTVPIVVRGYESEEVDQALSKARCCVGRGWIRQLAPFMVSVPRRELDRMCRDGLVSTHESGVDVYRGRYDSLFGIGMGTEYDPADLTV
jgi:CRISPR-associated endonuclease/helicase Cas3